MIWIGALAGLVAIIWLLLAARRRYGVAAKVRCPECGGDLVGYEQSPTCPHCFVIRGEDPDDDDEDEPGSVDEIDEDYDEPEER